MATLVFTFEIEVEDGAPKEHLYHALPCSIVAFPIDQAAEEARRYIAAESEKHVAAMKRL